MSLFWVILMPAFLLFTGAIAFFAVQLKFFSNRARDLDQIDISHEVSEIPLNQLELLTSKEDDFSSLTRRQRRVAVTRRLREARQSLHLVISNAALFQEVARFHIQAAPSAADTDDLPFKVMDRASVVHLLAAGCLLKLRLVNFFRILFPMYAPKSAGKFQLGHYDLAAWYKGLSKEMLELTRQYYDDVVYSRLIHQLGA